MNKQTAIFNLDEKLKEYINAKSSGGKSISYGMCLGMLVAYNQCGILNDKEFEAYSKKINDTLYSG